MEHFEQRLGYDNTQSKNIPKGTEVTLITETIPTNGLLLRISHFANYVSDIMAWGSISWTPYINDVPVAMYYDTRDQLGDPANPRELGAPIIARGGDVLKIKAKNLTDPATGTDYSAGVSVKGGFGFFKAGGR